MDHDLLAAKIVKSNRYLSLGTCSSVGPWVAPLAFTVEADFSFVFYSEISSNHCSNISSNSQVAGAIFDSTAPSDTADGIQFIGVCSAVLEPDLQPVLNRYFLYSFPDEAVRARWMRPVNDFTGASPQRFYRIRLSEIYKPDPSSVKIDRRIKLEVANVAEAYRTLGV
jgi:uncharacterized protein YhbP (UPF0306 family)